MVKIEEEFKGNNNTIAKKQNKFLRIYQTKGLLKRKH